MNEGRRKLLRLPVFYQRYFNNEKNYLFMDNGMFAE
jgi:hypothetical protein